MQLFASPLFGDALFIEYDIFESGGSSEGSDATAGGSTKDRVMLPYSDGPGGSYVCGSVDVGSVAVEGFNDGCAVPSSPHSTLKTDCRSRNSNGDTSRDSPRDPNKAGIRNLRSVLDKVHRHSDPVQVPGAQLLPHLQLIQSLFLKTLSCPDYLGFLRSSQCFVRSTVLS